MSWSMALQQKKPLMKMNLRSLPVYALALTVSFTACKKETDKQTEDNTTEVKGHSEDQNQVSASLDGVAADVSFALESVPTFSGRLQNVQNINNTCSTTFAIDTSNNTWTIALTYNGADCFNTHYRHCCTCIFPSCTGRC